MDVNPGQVPWWGWLSIGVATGLILGVGGCVAAVMVEADRGGRF